MRLYLLVCRAPSILLPPLPRSLSLCLARATTFVPRRGPLHAFLLLRPGRSSPFFYRREQAVASLFSPSFFFFFLWSSSRTIPHSLDAVAHRLQRVPVSEEDGCARLTPSLLAGIFTVHRLCAPVEA